MAPDAENHQVLPPVVCSVAVRVMNVEHLVFFVVAAVLAPRTVKLDRPAAVSRRGHLVLVVVRLDEPDPYVDLLRVILAGPLAEAQSTARSG